jgi:hypothetical protein
MPAHRIYVSVNGNDLREGSGKYPVHTPGTALKRIGEYRAEHPGRDIRVILGKGTWYLEEPITITPATGGSERSKVTWEGDPGGGTIISGGREITDFHDAGYGLWWAEVDPGFVFSELYIDGVRATRARIPDETDSMPRFYLESAQWNYNPDSTVRNITVKLNDRGMLSGKITNGEFELVVFKDWTTSRFRVSGLETDPARVFLEPPFALFDGSYNSIFAGNANRYSCFLEGDPAFIDEPGEWALDATGHRLYYKPASGQDPEKVHAIAGKLTRLVEVAGERGNPVRNVEFRDIRFENQAFRLPPGSHDGMQAAFSYPGKSDPSGRPGLIDPVITMHWATGCRVDRCTLKNDAGNGICLLDGCRDNRLENLKIEDIGANGVMIGLTRDPGMDSLLLPRNNILAGSTLTRTGSLFQGAVGIWLGFCAGNEVSGCEVSDMPYTGISVGWQWNPLPSSSKGNRILNNKIHHVMKMLGDGGGIYTLGDQPGSVISGNDIHDILRSELNHASPNNGMFIDEGSKGYLVKDNTISRTAHTCIRGHRAAGVELTGNTFYSDSLPAISHTPPYSAMIFANHDTTIRWVNPGIPGYPDTVTAFTMKGNRFLKGIMQQD